MLVWSMRCVFLYLFLIKTFRISCFTLAYDVQRHEERVIIISSKDSEGTFTDAENALHQIACLILKVRIYFTLQAKLSIAITYI